MQKIGWHTRLRDPENGGSDFRVLDVARRVGSGVGSFGVDRYNVLLAGRDLRVYTHDIRFGDCNTDY